MIRFFSLFLLCLLSAPALAAEPAVAQGSSPHAIDIPPWFKDSFLNFKIDIQEATTAKKRTMLYFGQDGCPYCIQLMQVNFSQKDIVAKMQQHIEAIALNMWGDRETIWLDGKPRTEKELAAYLRVQFTPTLLFLDETGNVVLRINGYYSPHKFRAALGYVSGKLENQIRFPDYLKASGAEPASGILHDQPFFMGMPYHLKRTPTSKPLMVLFEQKECNSCDEMHAQAFKNTEFLGQLKQFDVVRLSLFGKTPIITPDGKHMTEAEWGRALKVAYTPGIVFFDASGKEVFRADAYLKTFHLNASLDYVASKGYLAQPSFQRFVEARADKLRKAGIAFDLWE